MAARLRWNRDLSPSEARAFWAGVVMLIAFGVSLWVFSDLRGQTACDWYCGPAPYIVAAASPAMLLGAEVIAVPTVIETFVRRHWVTASACALVALSPVTLIVVMVLTAPLRAI